MKIPGQYGLKWWLLKVITFVQVTTDYFYSDSACHFDFFNNTGRKIVRLVGDLIQIN